MYMYIYLNSKVNTTHTLLSFSHIIIIGEIGKIDILARDLLVETDDILGGRLEVRLGVQRVGDENIVTEIRVGHQTVSDSDELLLDGTEDIEGGLKFSLGLVGLDVSGDNGDVKTLLADLMDVRHHKDENIGLSIHLSLRNDHLERGDILGVGDGVIQDTDASDDLASGLDLLLVTSLQHVRRMANDSFALSGIGAASDTANLATLVINDLLNVLIQHESTTMDGAHSGETFGDTTQTVDGVQEGRVTISAMRVHVQLDLLDALISGSLNETIISVKGNSVTDEIDDIDGKIVLLDHSREVILHGVDLAGHMSLLIVFVEFLAEDEEVLDSILLKETHKIGFQGFRIVSGHLEDLGTTRREETTLSHLVHEGTVDSLPLQVSGDSGLEQNLDQISVGHNELRDKIDIPISVHTILLGDFDSRSEKLPKVGQVQGSTLISVVGVSVNMEDLLAILGQETRKDRLCEAGTTDNNVILLIHGYDWVFIYMYLKFF